MASSPLSSPDMVDPSRGLTGSDAREMRREPGKLMSVRPKTTGRKAAARPLTPA